MGQRKIAILIITLLAVLSVFIFISARFTSQTMSPIYTGLSLDDSAKIVSELDKNNVQYELRANGTQILVPSDQVLRLRLTLAQSGLPAMGSIVGYEIFDRSETMGTSSFVMNINMLRALEGELARTISSLSQVETARVHLVIPKQEIFSHDKQETTASVVLKLRGMSELTKEEVGGITHLVAAAVPGLKPSKVTLLDSSGHLLAGGNGDENDVSVLAETTEEYRMQYQTHMKSTLERLLERTVGSGKVKVTVNADINFDRVVTNSETFDPNGQVARSVQETEEKEQSGEKEAASNTTAANNLPNAQANQGSNGSSRMVDKTDATTNYEISKTVQNHIEEAGKVNKLSVAVMVDGTYTEDPKTNKQTYAPRSAEELKQIETLVKSAIGYDEKRGDNVQIVNMRFITSDEDMGNLSFIESIKQDIHGVIQTLVFGAVAALVILLIIRPIVMRIMDTTMAAASTEAVAVPAGGPSMAGVSGVVPVRADGGVAAEVPEEESIDISRVTGRVKSSSYNRLNELLERHPEEALNVIRQWAAKRT